jgi:RNA polymerase sigma factor (sigma-70 family)
MTAEGPPFSKVVDELLPLAQAASIGDATALRTLLSRVAPTMLRVVRRVTGAQHPEVEDVTQECALEFVRALRQFRHESSVQHFASRVALRVAMNARRRRRASKRTPEFPADFVDPDDAEGESPQPDAHLASRSAIAVVRELCDELPPAQAEVLALHCVLGHTMNEVSTICGAPLETVRSRLRAARVALVERAMTEPLLREILEVAP